MSRTNPQPARSLGEEALARICVSAYPMLVSEAYASLLASHAIDPLARVGRPCAVANAEGAALVCRATWLRFREPAIYLQTAPCNDYHVCTLLDAEFQPFASVGTRTAGNARQELALFGPGSIASTTRDMQGIRCPTDLIAVLTHHVHFGHKNSASNGSPFRIEDQDGTALVDLAGPVETLDAVGHVEARRPEQYFIDALQALGETSSMSGGTAVKHAVQKSFATDCACRSLRRLYKRLGVRR